MFLLKITLVQNQKTEMNKIEAERRKKVLFKKVR